MKKTQKSEMFISTKSEFKSEIFILTERCLFFGYNFNINFTTHSTWLDW
jgi:hypothetical protein